MVQHEDGLAGLFSDLVRLETALWNQLDRKLEVTHGVPLRWFEPMRVVSLSKKGHLKVNEIAEALMITVGGTSKVVDRITDAGYFRREPDPGDRRVSRVVLTPAGKRKLASASKTHRRELERLIAGTLDAKERRQLGTLIGRLLEPSRPTSTDDPIA